MGDNLKVIFQTQLRQAKLKNVTDLSYESGIPVRDIERLFNSQLKNKDMDTLEKLANFFGCRISSMVFNGAIWSFKGNAYDSTSGVVYFIRDTDTGLTKIGCTKDLFNRISSLKVEHKKEMKLVHYIGSYDVYGLEKVMHNIFSDKRVNGEWFDLTDEDIRMVKGEKEKSLVATNN